MPGRFDSYLPHSVRPQHQHPEGSLVKDRKLDTSLSANNAVALKRLKFDQHINTCATCQPSLCHVAEALWREVCLTALRTQKGGE